jgi:hypothetical protein
VVISAMQVAHGSRLVDHSQWPRTLLGPLTMA